MTWAGYTAEQTMHSTHRTAASARSGSRTKGTGTRRPESTTKHWQTTAAQTHTSMLQRLPGRGSTQGTRGISPEPLAPKIPALPHAAARSACSGAPGSPASAERMVTVREDGEEDELPTAGLAQKVD